MPLDESPLMPVSIVFHQLPEALAAVKDKPILKDATASEWVEAKGYVSAAGYYFKTMSVPGDRANTDRRAGSDRQDHHAVARSARTARVRPDGDRPECGCST